MLECSVRGSDSLFRDDFLCIQLEIDPIKDIDAWRLSTAAANFLKCLKGIRNFRTRSKPVSRDIAV